MLAMGLSIAIVTMSVLVLHLLFGLKITGANSLVAIAIIIIAGVAAYIIKRNISGRGKSEVEE